MNIDDIKIYRNLIKHLQDLPRAIYVTILITLVILIITTYYLSIYDSVASFVIAIDHNEVLFQDFLWHYYPMGQTILDTPIPVHGFYYSALTALLLVPIGLLQPATAIWGWGLFQIVSLIALITIPLFKLLRLPPLGIALYVGVCISSFPLLHNSNWGQVSALLVAFIIASFYADTKNNPVLAGVLLAIAAIIKYYPAVFLIYFIVNRNYRACISFFITVIVLYAIFPAAILGLQPWLLFEKVVLTTIFNLGWVVGDVNSQYFVHVIERLINYQPVTREDFQILTVIGYLIFFFSMVVLWLINKWEMSHKSLLSIILIFLSLPFVIKTSWPHYFCYLPFCQVAIFMYFSPYRYSAKLWKKALLLLPVISITCSSMFVFNLFPDWTAFSFTGMLFISNLILLLSVYLIIFGRESVEQLSSVGNQEQQIQS